MPFLIGACVVLSCGPGGFGGGGGGPLCLNEDVLAGNACCCCLCGASGRGGGVADCPDDSPCAGRCLTITGGSLEKISTSISSNLARLNDCICFSLQPYATSSVRYTHLPVILPMCNIWVIYSAIHAHVLSRPYYHILCWYDKCHWCFLWIIVRHP